MNNLLKTILSASAVMCALTACEVEDYNLSDLDTDDLELSTGLSAPLGRSTVTIEDLLKNQDIEGLGYDSTGLIVFQYDTIQHFSIEGIEFQGFSSEERITVYDLLTDSLKSLGFETLEEFISFDDDVTVELPINNSVNIGTNISMSEILANSEDQRIDSVYFKKGNIKVTIESNIEGLLESCDVSLGLLTSNNKIISTVSGRADKSFNLDLSNVMVRLDKNDSIRFEGSLTNKRKAEVTVNKDSYFGIKLEAENGSFMFSKVWGIFNGLEPVIGSEKVDIDLYDKNKNEGMAYNLQLVDPKIEIAVNSNIGIPFKIGINKLEASNTTESLKATFRDGKESYSANLGYAKEIGQTVTAIEETFDSKNGSIDKLINLLPTAVGIDYNFEALGGDVTNKKNYFLTDDAFIDFKLKVNLPAYIRKGSFITISDTIENINLGEDLDEKYSFDLVKVKADVVNSLPFDANLKFHFLQEDTINGIIVLREIPNKNLEKTITVKAGIVGENDMVKKSTTSAQLIEFRKEDIPDLKRAKHLRIEYDVAVKDFEKVKVTRDNSLSVNLKGYVKGNVYVNKF